MDMLGKTRIVQLTDTTLAWTELGEGPPLVLLHGLGDSHRTFRRVAPRLAQRFRVILPDLPGHGLSGRPDAPYTLGWYARTMAEFLDALDVPRAHWLGHSFGGGVAQWLALEHAARVDRLALVAPGGLGPEVGIGLRLAAFPVLGPLLAPPLMALGTRAMMHVAGAEFGHPEPDEIDRVAWMNTAPGSGRAFVRTVRGCIDLFGQTMQTWDRIHEIDALPPIGLFWGDRDRILPVRQGVDAFARLEGARFWPYSGVGHFPHLEESARFTEDLSGFLDDTFAAPRPRVRISLALPRKQGRFRRFFAQLGQRLRAAIRSLGDAAA